MTTPILTKIETVLDEVVRPALAEHSGNVTIETFTDGVLRVRLTGRCSGCPSATATTEAFIAEKIQARFPEIERVLLVTAVSDDLIAQAKAFLRHEYPR